MVCHDSLDLIHVYLLPSSSPTMNHVPFTSNLFITPVVCQLLIAFSQYLHPSSLALPLIAEHLSILWSKKSVSADDISPTIALCHTSQVFVKVMQAVDQVLSQYPGSLPALPQHRCIPMSAIPVLSNLLYL